MSQPLRVLLAEDNPNDAELVLRALRQAGFDPDLHQVETEEDYLDELTPDLDIILSDYEMPTFSGPHALKLLQQSGYDIPFIIISGTIGEDVAVEMMRLGATDYLLKDRLVRLGISIRQAMAQGQLRRDTAKASEDLKRSEKELRWKTAFLEAQVAASIDGIMVVNERRRKILQNQRMIEIFQIPQHISDDGDARCQLEWITSRVVNPESFLDRVRHLYAHRDEVGRDEMELKDGTVLDRYSSPVVGSDGQYYGRIWAFRDITERKKAALALLESKRFLQSTLDALTTHIAILDEHGTIVEVNSAWNRFAIENGFKSAGYGVGENYLTLCDRATGRFSEEAAVVAQGIRSVMAGSQPEFHLEYPCHGPHGPRYFVVRVTRFCSDGPLRAVVAHENITERKLAEEALRESEERFRQIAETIQEVFWITDTSKHHILYVSQAYERIWGRTCESLRVNPQNWLEAIHPEDRERVLLAATTRQVNGTYDEEYRVIRPDGSVRWIHDRAFPVHNAAGEVYRVAGVAQDITEHKGSRDRLLEQASLLDKARDAILVRHLEHGITYWNKSAELLYGWSFEEAKGRHTGDFLYRDTVGYKSAIEAVLSKGEWRGEIQQITKSGAPVLVEARWTLVRDDTGRPQAVLAINSDITEKKKLEQQFLRAQRMESIGTLAGGIAHDLNNVLAPILMSIELLRLTSRDQRALTVLSTIETSAKRGADMVKQILSFARGVEGERMVIDVRHVIQDMQHLVQDTFPKEIVFRSELDKELPLFSGDHTQLHQVLLNLCVNARDAMPHGGTLSVSATSLHVDDNYAGMTPGSTPGRYLMIKVTDSGTGIPPEVVDKIFDPFFTTKEQGKGTGLGLSTVLSIVRSHGGFLNVYSEPGNGTTFSVCFPAMEAPEGVAARMQQDTHPRGNGELILIVDDEAAVRAITEQTLESYGYRVLVAADGTEAVALYSIHRLDVAAVVTDMMMPVMGGQATIQVLQRLNPDVKIIAASGLANDGSSARATAMGVKHFLPKPFTAQTILTALHEVLTGRS
ncbi:PAS domain S-box protein [Prosthecobacter sp.]|uniref:PAS domain S-box protein n=1 Tax=Prosthecobacter sp. TaxID=1965333 RepID=UPI00378476D1